MPTGLPLLKSHPKTLSKLICSRAHKDKFMEPPQTLQKYIFIPTASQIVLRKPPRGLKECQKATTYIEPNQTLSKINSSPTTAPDILIKPPQV
jgi:hypothetical protein